MSEQIGVYQAINKVQTALAKTGISKDRTNSQQGYKFRGIDDVYAAVSPLLAEHGLCILPRMLSRSHEERQTAKGGVLFYVTVEAEFDFVSVADGSKHTVRTFGEAMDSGDKATNKAMSAAYKYAAFQAFAIPTEGDNDADAHTPDVAPKSLHTPAAKASAELIIGTLSNQQIDDLQGIAKTLAQKAAKSPEAVAIELLNMEGDETMSRNDVITVVGHYIKTMVTPETEKALRASLTQQTKQRAAA